MQALIILCLLCCAFFAYREYNFLAMNKQELIGLLRQYRKVKYRYGTTKLDSAIKRIERRIDALS